MTRRTPIYDGRIIQVHCDQVELPGGNLARREVVEHLGGVGVVALDEQDRVLLVRQYRYPFSRELIEIPAGSLTRGEDPADCGRRELLEETGATAGRFTPLGSFLPSPAVSSQVLYLYLAEQLTFGPMHLDDDEFLTVGRMPFRTLVQRILAGEIEDAKTIIGILKVWSMRTFEGGTDPGAAPMP
ncbi:MAG: NUDIX hydrolase [Clostridiales bacterium]|nr:NUDIX hydrolase [Clostridiales bacterium]